MFTIDTSTSRWRRVATTGLALPMAFMLSGTALAAGPSTDLQQDSASAESSSTAKMTIDVDCFTVAVTSNKDISNVKVTFADGSFQEIEHISGYSFNRTFAKAIASATSKSATTTVSDSAGSCAAPVEEEQPPVEDETPVEETPVEEEQPVEEAPAEETPVEEAPVEDDKATQGNGTANISIEVDCRTIRVVSDKDISNVKVTFADGSFQEIEHLSGYTFDGTFAKDIASATSKSATTTVADDAGSCSAPAEETPAEETPAEETPADETPAEETPADEDEAPVCPTKPVMGPVMEGCESDEEDAAPGNGTANISIEVDCYTVRVVSDKDISNVKVTFADGEFREINGLSGYTFDRTFTKEIASATAKSATTTVADDAGSCAAPVEETPVEETPAEETPAEETPAEETPAEETPAPVCPTEQVMGPVMEGCEVDETPAEEAPVEEAPVEEAPVEEAPVEEAPVEEAPVDNTPIGGQPEPQPATGGGTPAEETQDAEAPTEEAPVQENTPISGQPAQAPATSVVNNGAVAPVVVTAAPAIVEATPTALPFTGANAETLAGLGTLLLLAGGGAVVAGRRERAVQTA